MDIREEVFFLISHALKCCYKNVQNDPFFGFSNVKKQNYVGRFSIVIGMQNALSIFCFPIVPVVCGNGKIRLIFFVRVP